MAQRITHPDDLVEGKLYKVVWGDANAYSEITAPFERMGASLTGLFLIFKNHGAVPWKTVLDIYER